MKIRAKAINIEEVEIALTLTMRVSDWRDFKKLLPEKWPAWQIGNQIFAAINKLETTYDEELTKE